MSDVLGREVAVLVDEELPAGEHKITFTPSATLPSGIYIYRLTTGRYLETKKNASSEIIFQKAKKPEFLKIRVFCKMIFYNVYYRKVNYIIVSIEENIIERSNNMPIKTKLTGNKEKIGTMLDRDILRKIKERSAKEGRTISVIIQDALIKYNDTSSTKSELRRAAVNRFCSKPFNLNTRELNALLSEDIYEL